MFREDLRVTMAASGLYEWLLKVVSVSGVLGGEEGDAADAQAHEESKKEREREKDDKKQMLGEWHHSGWSQVRSSTAMLQPSMR